jgi:class 3 adenylate cyclase/tetratricopeptide (TPR) repeat protein
MRCFNCNADNPFGKKFCGDCGAPLANLCPNCGADNPTGKRFCGDCGASLTSPAPDTAKKRDAPPVRLGEALDADNIEGERKTVTALFADIKGSTELEQDLDPEEARAIVDPALKLMIDSVQRYDGYVVQSTGDGIFAIFGAPVAHEDHPQRALYSALRMQDELRRYSTKLVADGGNPLEARIGASTGEVVVRPISTGKGHVEYTPIGHTANLASRMQAVAPTGSIAIGENTRKLVEGYFALKPRGPTRVKGIAEPVNVYEVTGLGPLRTRLQRAAGRGLTKFVGREREMEALRRALEQAQAGRGQIAAAVAEAGTGKSRLFFEFKAKNQSGWMVLEAFSVSHGKASAYLPVLDLLHTYFKITSDDDARTRREKVNGRIVTLDPALEDTRPYLFALLGIVEGDDPLAQMDAQIKKRRTLDAIKRILLRESLNQPLIVMFEDLHWIDEQTQELLNLLADSIANAKILLLVNYRPQYSHHWNSKTYYTQLRLDPLGKESADEMLAALLGSSALARSVAGEGKPGEQPGAGEGADLAALKHLIIEKTEGNPFFMEETVQVLLDEGALVRNGATHLTKPIGELKIPPTVQGILAARIDRLPADEKDLLQTLAVMGKEFTLGLVRAVRQHPHPRGTAQPTDAAPLALSRDRTGEGQPELERMLNDLQLSEFIYEQPAVGDVEYAFKHALTQEVAYNSVLIERRKQLHERIGTALEAAFAENLDDQLPELAHHYSRSANRAKAFEFLHRAGDQAVGRASYAEAESYFAAALEVLAAMPESPERDARELRVRSSFARSMAVTSGFGTPEVREMAARARALAEKTGNLPELVRQTWSETVYAEVRGNYSAQAALADQLLEIAQREGSPASLALAHTQQLQSRFFREDCLGAEEHFERGSAFFDAPGFLQLEGVEGATFGFASLLAWVTGRADTARERIRRCLEGTQHNPYDVAHGQIHAALLYVFLGEFERAEALAARALSQSEERGFPEVALWSLPVLGCARGELGRTGEGIALLRKAVAGITESGVRGSIVLMLTVLARVQMLDGAIADALGTIEDALKTNPEELVYQPEAYRVRGELRLKQGDRSLAEADFREAITLAQKMGAKAWELRATTSLARLLRDTNRRDEAHAMLAEIYDWFTEGLDTADLKDAKSLLDELKLASLNR